MTEQERIEYLEAELQKLKQKTKSTTTTSYERQTTYKQESSLLDKVVDGAAFGVGFSIVDNIVDSFFD